MLDSTGKKCDKKHNPWVHGGTSSYVNVHMAHDVSDPDDESVGEFDEEVEDIENFEVRIVNQDTFENSESIENQDNSESIGNWDTSESIENQDTDQSIFGY